MALNDTIHIEVLAKLHPKSEGIDPKDQAKFAKEIRKQLEVSLKSLESDLVDAEIAPDIRLRPDVKPITKTQKSVLARKISTQLDKIIKDTTKALKVLELRPEIVAHPKFKGFKDVRGFIAAVKREGRALMKQSKAEFEKLSPTAQVKIKLDVDKAKKEFTKQLDVLQRSLKSLSKKKAREIEVAINSNLTLSPRVMQALQSVAQVDQARHLVTNAVKAVPLKGQGVNTTSSEAAIGRALYKRLGNDLTRLSDANIDAVRQYLEKTTKTLQSRLEATPNSPVRRELEDAYKRQTKQLVELNRRSARYYKQQDKQAKIREQRLKTVESILSKGGVAGVRAGQRDLTLNLLKKLRNEVNREFLQTGNKVSARSLVDIDSAIKELKHAIQLTGNNKEALKLRDAVNKKFGEKLIKRQRDFSNSHLRSMRLIEQSISKGIVRKDGRLEKLDTPDKIKNAKRLYTGLQEAVTSGLLKRDVYARALYKDLSKEFQSVFERQRRTTLKRGALSYRRSGGDFSKINDFELKDVKAFLRHAIDTGDARARRMLESGDLGGVAKVEKQLNRLVVAEKTASEAIRDRAKTTQRIIKEQARLSKEMADYTTNTRAYNRERRRSLEFDLRQQKNRIAAQLRNSRLTEKQRLVLHKAFNSLSDSIEKIAPTLKGALSDADRLKYRDSVANTLGTNRKNILVDNKFTKADDRFLVKLNDTLKTGFNNLAPLGKGASQLDKDIRHQRLLEASNELSRAYRRGIISQKEFNSSSRLFNAAMQDSTGVIKSYNNQFRQRLSEFQAKAALGEYKTKEGSLTGKSVGNHYLKLLTSQTEQVNAALTKTRENIDTLSRLKERGDISGKTKKKLDDLASALRRDESALESHKTALVKDTEEVRKTTAGIKTPLDKDRQGIGLLLRQFARLYIGFAVLGGVVQGVLALTRELTNLDTSLKSIQAAALGTTDQLVGIESAIQTVGITTKFTISEIADAARILVQADVPLKDIPDTLRATANLASATDTDVATSADLLTSFGKVYTEYTPDQVASLLAKTFNLSKLAGEDLKVILGIATQTASTMGLTGEQFLSALVVMRNQGIKASTIATGLRQALNEVFAPDTKTLKVLKSRYDAIGEAISGDDIKRRFASFRSSASPLISVLTELKRLGFGGSAKVEFSRFIDLRAENALSALVNQMDELSKREFQLPFGDTATKASEIQLRSLEATVKNLGAAITTLSSSAFKPLIENLKDAAKGMTDFLTEVKKMNDEVVSKGGTGLEGSLTTSLLGAAAGYMGAKRLGFGSITGRTVGTAVGGIGGLGAGVGSVYGGVSPDTINSLLSVALFFSNIASAFSAVKGGIANKLRSGVKPSELSAIEGIIASATVALGSSEKSLKARATGLLAASKKLVSGANLLAIFTMDFTKILGIVFKAGKFLFGSLTGIGLLVTAYTALTALFGESASLQEKLAANKAILSDANAELGKVIRETDQFINEEGATAASVFAAQKESVAQFYKTLKENGIKESDFAEIETLIQEVGDTGFDAMSASYSSLKETLIDMTGMQADKVGQLISTLYQLNNKVTGSTQAVIEEMKKEIDGIRDKQEQGIQISDASASMLTAWDSLIASNRDVYVAFMGSLQEKSLLAKQDMEAALNTMFNAIRIQAQKARAEANAIAQNKIISTFGNTADLYSKDFSKRAFNDYTDTESINARAEFKKGIDELKAQYKQGKGNISLQQFFTGINKLTDSFKDFTKTQALTGRITKDASEKNIRFAKAINNTLIQDLAQESKTQREFITKTISRAANEKSAAKAIVAELNKFAKGKGINFDEEVKTRVGAERFTLYKEVLDKLDTQKGQEELVSRIQSEVARGSDAKDNKLLKLMSDVFGNTFKNIKVKASVDIKQAEILNDKEGAVRLTSDLERASDNFALLRSQGATKENIAKAKELHRLQLKSLEIQLDEAKKDLNLLSKPAEGGLGAAPAEEILKKRNIVSKLEGKLLAEKETGLQRLIKSLGKGRSSRSGVDKAAKAEEAYRKRLLSQEIQALRKKLSSISLSSATTEAEADKLYQQRLEIQRKLNEKEKERAELSAKVASKNLRADLVADETVQRNKNFANKLKALQDKELVARDKIISGLLEQQRRESESAFNKSSSLLTKKYNQGSKDLSSKYYDSSNILGVLSESAKNLKDLGASASLTKLQLELYQSTISALNAKTDEFLTNYTKSVNKDPLLSAEERSKKIKDKTAEVKAAQEAKQTELYSSVSASTSALVDKFSSFVGNTAFGQQLEVLKSLVEITKETPWLDAFAQLPGTLADAVLDPIVQGKSDEEDTRSTFVRVRDSVEQAVGNSLADIGKSYFRQATAELQAGLLGNLLGIKDKEAIQKKLQEDQISALNGNTEALKRLLGVLGSSDPIKAATDTYGGTDGEGGQDNPIDKVVTDFKDKFTSIFSKKGSVWEKVSNFFSDLFKSGEKGSFGSFFAGLFKGGGKGGGVLGSIFKWGASLLGFSEGVAGFRKKTGVDSVPAIGHTDGSNIEPIWLNEGESVLTKKATSLLGSDTINAFNSGDFSAMQAKYAGSGTVVVNSPDVVVPAPVANVFVTPEQIELAINTQKGKAAIAEVVREVGNG